MSTVSVVACKTYELSAVRAAVQACLHPLGGISAFIQPGMRVLLKPNLLMAPASYEQAVTTHPAVLQAVAELVKAAGAEVWIGDSPAGPLGSNPAVWRKTGAQAAAEAVGASMAPFEHVVWKGLNEKDYFIARPVTEADFIISLPKLKTHALTLYTGAVKNLLGVIPGTRKSEVHVRAPGIQDFSAELVNLLELVRPGLSIMDGVLGQEGAGPGVNGTPHPYGILAASIDPVALDTVMTQAMGFRTGEVLHLAQAGARGLGVSYPGRIETLAEPGVLDFGKLDLPKAHFYQHVPAWVSKPLQGRFKLKPIVDPALCTGDGKCLQVCPTHAITNGKPVQIDYKVCIGCMCCAEVCPSAAIDAKPSTLARMIGIGS